MSSSEGRQRQRATKPSVSPSRLVPSAKPSSTLPSFPSSPSPGHLHAPTGPSFIPLLQQKQHPFKTKGAAKREEKCRLVAALTGETTGNERTPHRRPRDKAVAITVGQQHCARMQANHLALLAALVVLLLVLVPTSAVPPSGSGSMSGSTAPATTPSPTPSSSSTGASSPPTPPPAGDGGKSGGGS